MFRRPSPILCSLTTAAVLLVCRLTSSSAQEPIDGFVTPFRTIDVATAETGIVRDIAVVQGETVEPGQVLARLDDELYASLLAMAQKSTEASGRLRAAQTEYRIREQRLGKLQELIGQGSARPEEVERAGADAEIAAAQLRAIQEELAIKQLDFERARLQLERRTVRAPAHGVVLQLKKEPGEFIGQNDPYLMTIVQLDPLLAVFAVPSIHARRMRTGEAVQVRLPEMDVVVQGAVETIAPVVDGKSGTMRVEVRMSNPDRRFLSGEPCTLLFSPPTEPNDESLPAAAPVPADTGRTGTVRAYEPRATEGSAAQPDATRADARREPAVLTPSRNGHHGSRNDSRRG